MIECSNGTNGGIVASANESGFTQTSMETWRETTIWIDF